MPSHLVPRHKPEETKLEYQLRIEHAKEKRRQEIQILESRRDSYEKKTKIMGNEIDTMIKTRYDVHTMKENYCAPPPGSYVQDGVLSDEVL